MDQLIKITEFILKSFLHIWPYLLVTIPLSVLVNLSGASKYITRAFSRNPLISVFLATCIGAFSPFCSCGVIPVITSLLTGGVPLAPVMSFWIASPSMDPEIFFLSSSVIGWKLAVWRLASTFLISLLAGYITHLAITRGFIDSDVLNLSAKKSQPSKIKFFPSLRSIFFKEGKKVLLINSQQKKLAMCCQPLEIEDDSAEFSNAAVENKCKCTDQKNEIPQWKKISGEVVNATLLVTKFMGIAFLITALITFYLPGELVTGMIKGSPMVQVIIATLTGIPMYTSNITALPMIGGLLNLGLNEGAALSFLIAGATTTFPAMVAVWGITKRKIFLLYLSFALFGSFLAGLFFNLFN